MKILFCFLDMLRADLLKIYGNDTKSLVDDFFYELGGTVYTNCYTPGPDTPRSSTCMFTGQYPKINGCNARVKYPEFFLNENIDNIFNTFENNNIKIHIYLDKYNRDIGFLPKGFNDEKFTYGSDFVIQDYLKTFDPEDNSFSFLYFPDFHNVVMDNAYSSVTPKKGLKKINDILMILKNNITFEDFDYIFFISDHGYTLKKDKGKNVLDSQRSRILLFVHKKNDTSIDYNDKLCSTLDFFTTFANLFDLQEPKNEGIDLFSENEHEYVLLEDHSDFSVNVHQCIEKYGIITKNHKYFTDITGKWYHNDSNFTDEKKKKFESLLKEKMTDYEKNSFLYERLQFYERFETVKYNSDGTLRRKSFKRRFKTSKLFSFFRFILYPFLRFFI